MIKKKKFCGILQETLIHEGKKFMIVGIGINIKKSPYIADYPTCHINEFSNKKVNKFYIYSLIKKGFEKILNVSCNRYWKYRNKSLPGKT